MKKVALISTSRADYGIQSRVIQKLSCDKDVDFSLIVSGSHLSKKHGETYQEIEKDGIKIADKIDIGIDEYSDDCIEKIMGNALILISQSLKKIKPDIVILLGDRFEMLSASMACVLLNIPIAHLHGGETTEGAFDEVFRHAITKASCLHFTACEEYRKRVIQLGEQPTTVYNVGALGVENTVKLPLKTKQELSHELNIEYSRKNILVTFHPVTFEKGSAKKQVEELLKALDCLDETTIVFTQTNADSENEEISKAIEQFVNSHKNVYLFSSLGTLRYLSLVKTVDAVVGNSSSGIIEVPSFKTPTINIGDRQKGRVQAKSIINCLPKKESILEALQKAFTPEFQEVLKNVENPFFKKDTAEQILSIIKNTDLSNVLKKKFYDL